MLYIEKEGFDPLIEQAQIAEWHDLAIMSCKGMSVTAAPRTRRPDLHQNLIDNDATEAEIAFLLDTDNPDAGNRTGKRVELNAMTSRQFIGLIERKLAEHGIGKVIPDEDRINEAYRLFVRNGRIKQVVEDAIEAMDAAPIDVSPGLAAKVREYLEDHPEASWDSAVRILVDDGDL